MDFARKQLEKYGWSEGKGLGKNEDGISSALKPKLKFDNAGVGHDVGQQFTNNWWENLFNAAAQNIDVHVDEGAIKMKLKSKDSIEITDKNYSLTKLKKNNSLEYGTFLKTAKLTESGMETYKVKTEVVEEPLKRFTALTDDELFAACGGRTAHKGARHGLKLSGKLSRIEKQEKLLLKKMKKVSLCDERANEKEKVEKKLRKLKKQKDENSAGVSPEIIIQPTAISSPLKKKSNKKRKTVTFNETVTKYYTADDLDTSFDNEVGSLRDENSNEPVNIESAGNGSDEGIEFDIENNNNNSVEDDNHKSFEEAQLNINDLSKAERKKLKKKRKLEAKKNTATGKFLEELKLENSVDDNISSDLDSEEKEFKPKKRKLCFEHPECSNAKCQLKMKVKKIKHDERQITSITQSMGSFCRISDDE